jgi:hypothetical protein
MLQISLKFWSAFNVYRGKNIEKSLLVRFLGVGMAFCTDLLNFEKTNLEIIIDLMSLVFIAGFSIL